MNITRNQAICMLFCEEYSDDNATRLAKKIEQLGAFDVCYENDPRRPVLLTQAIINSQPSIFKRYETSSKETYNDKTT
ncbi:hypothetical protein BDB00DRAFT_810754 [Zychaea mexicana]|uniref:uncharacterized protein n=1 Tax=Zychaea mexicana TaxID=64656 RepID=UPI0022FEDF8C|nr:uncharacterized protein BDB00DRAFT_810754 [Zychaea mexicana]KAI9496161.1 hypothetical protein BDB00DRAFT_810754 [Zychaea mexicana]